MDDLVSAFGERLLAYLLGCDHERIPPDLDSNQVLVVEQLRRLLTQDSEEDSLQKTSNLRAALLAYDRAQGTTLANLLRMQAGGTVAQYHCNGDVLVAELIEFARNVHAGYLIQPPGEWSMSVAALSSAGVREHPYNRRLAHMILADGALSKLFPGFSSDNAYDESTIAGRVSSYFIASSGHAGGINPILLPGQILDNAYDRLIATEEPTLEAYLDSVVLVLSDMRRLAARKVIDIRVIVNLSNIRLEDDRPIDIPGGILRSVRALDERWIYPIDPRPSAFLVTTAPLQLVKLWPTEPADPPAAVLQLDHRFEQDRIETQRRINIARFALLLATREAPYHAAQQGTTRLLDPLYMVGVATGSQPTFSHAPETIVTLSSANTVSEWSQRVQAHPHSLDIAMRRLLLAATSRADPLDSFVDAVLAWENMFSGTPETILRVCGSIALLLEPSDHERRSALYRELKELYQVRSYLVHGKSEPKSNKVGYLRDRSIEIGLQAMRRLYELPELLNQPDSAKRGESLLLRSGATIVNLRDDRD